MVLSQSLLLLAALLPGQAPRADFHHDFRGAKPLPPMLELFGPAAETHVTPEEGGLRVKTPTEGKQTYGWGVQSKFTVSGDFEITGTYELIKIEAPAKRGANVGVALQVATDLQRTKFARLGRFFQWDNGVAYAANSFEMWTRPKPNTDWKGSWKPSTATAGQLRLRREGSMLIFLVADAPGNEFVELFKSEFGTDDLTVRFIVNNNSSRTLVDARLVDLKITGNKVVQNLVQANAQSTEPPEGQSTNWLLWAGLGGSAILLVIVAAVGALLFARRSSSADPRRETASVQNNSVVSFACATCGKNLKARSELVGKKVKCTQCGQAALVPGS